jgi:hypothetical protein
VRVRVLTVAAFNNHTSQEQENADVSKTGSRAATAAKDATVVD